MAEQRERAKKDAREKKTGNADISVYASLLEQAGKVTFTGYDAADGEAVIVGLLADGVPVRSATPGMEVAVVLDRTPFYAEGGGQLPDQGVIKTTGPGGNAEVEVTTCRRHCPAFSCTGVRSVTARSPPGRLRTRRSTLMAAGDLPQPHRHAPGAPARRVRLASRRQAGSENAPGRLRFDFTTGAVPVTVLRRGRGRGTGSSSTTSPCARNNCRTRLARWARLRCSARSTAPRSASSR